MSFFAKISRKLLLCFLCFGLIPAVSIALLSLYQANKGFEEQTFNQLEAITSIKQTQVAQYFQARQNDLQTLVEISSTLRHQAFQKLTAVREVKRNTLKNYFTSLDKQISTLASNPMLVTSVKSYEQGLESYLFSQPSYSDSQLDTALKAYYQTTFSPAFEAANNGKKPEYLEDNISYMDRTAKRLQNQMLLPPSVKIEPNSFEHTRLQRYYRDIDEILRPVKTNYTLAKVHIVSSKDARLIYSSDKALDFGTRFSEGPYANTGVSFAIQQALQSDSDNQSFYSDFEAYQPNLGTPSLFIASPIKQGDSVLGALVFQLAVSEINTAMAERTGLGKTGETYLVGNDYLLRSDTVEADRLSAENSMRYSETGRVLSRAISQGLAGRTGTGVVKNYAGELVLSTWTPVQVGNFKWALLAEIDVTEALSPVDQEGIAFYKKYATTNQYQDLLLINPDGQIFFTTANGRENQTNILEGEFKDSHLARLIEKTLANKQVGFADVASYRADNNQPATFMAIPLVHNDKVELVIAVRLSLAGINTLMQIDQGMGESGESYLVGPDKRMRSDAYHDPQNRSVKASFQGNVTSNGVDTEAVSLALAGDQGAIQSHNYQHNSVLAAYAPIQIVDQVWAMIAEIDENEAFAFSNTMRLLTLAVLCVTTLLIVAIGLLMSRQISSPIVAAKNLAEHVSAGNLTQEIKVTSKDEIGLLQNALATMNKNLKAMVLNIGESSEAQTNSAMTLSEITHQTKQHIEQQNINTEQVAAAIDQLSATVKVVSENTQLASTAANEAESAVSQGNGQVNNTIKEIHNFAEELDTISDALTRVQSGTRKITDIVDVINGIASQTNLLALNAAIEAARAGEKGRGFAVVADEVRALAQSTQDSTRQIEEMICELQQSSDASAQAMERGNNQMQVVVELAGNTEKALELIHSAVEKITSMNLQVATATEQQTRATDEIHKSIVEINQLSSHTSSDAEQVDQSSQELREQASSLRDQIKQFKT